MEPLIRYVSKNESLQDQIVCSENNPLIEATYRLFLHYGCPLGYMIKRGFRYELEVQGAGTIFRENRKTNLIISDFFQKFGGSFDYIVEKITQYSLELKPTKMKKDVSGPIQKFDPKTTNKVLLKCVDLIEDQLISIVSDSLVDFCSEVCLAVNTQSDKVATGEGIVCSFIVFRILAPKLLEGDCCGGTTLDRLKEIVRGLNRISLGDVCLPNSQIDKFILTQNLRFRNVVARALMKHRESPYCHSIELSALKHAQYTESFLNELNRSVHAESLDRLLEAAMNPKRVTSIASDLRYLALWSVEEVVALVRMQYLDEEFFRHWNINGANFLQLDKESLNLMGADDIEEILRCVADAKEFILTEDDLLAKGIANWHIKDVSVWLMMSGLSDLVGIFKAEGLWGQALPIVKVTDLRNIGITRPSDITKIMRLIQG